MSLSFPPLAAIKDRLASLFGPAPKPASADLPFDPAPFLSPDCPRGYQTVIGWLALRGLEAEDLGSRAGMWAWQQNMPRAIKVPAPPALLELGVCDVVRAYPVWWLDENAEEILRRRGGHVPDLFPDVSAAGPL